MLDAHASQALEHIYDTAVNPGSWRRALDATAETVDAKAIALVIRGKDAGAQDLTMMSSTYLNFSRTPAGWYYGSWLSRLQESDWDLLRDQRPHAPIPDLAAGRTAQMLDARKDYAFLRKSTGVSRRVGVRLSSDAVWFDAMSIGFDQTLTTVPEGLTDRLAVLMPHLSKALEMGRVFALLKARYNAALSALDRVQSGLAIALPDGRVIARNAEADRILSLSDGLSLTPSGDIQTTSTTLAAQIQGHILETSRTAQGHATRHEALLSIPRRSGLTPFVLDIGPVSDSQGELESGLDGALITLIDPERIPYLRLDRFTTLYKLTKAEAEVCRWITEGASTAEIAERRGTTPVTAKNQVASVLSKTGVRSRIELIRLVLRVLPPVA